MQRCAAPFFWPHDQQPWLQCRKKLLRNSWGVSSCSGMFCHTRIWKCLRIKNGRAVGGTNNFVQWGCLRQRAINRHDTHKSSLPPSHALKNFYQLWPHPFLVNTLPNIYFYLFWSAPLICFRAFFFSNKIFWLFFYSILVVHNEKTKCPQ